MLSIKLTQKINTIEIMNMLHTVQILHHIQESITIL